MGGTPELKQGSCANPHEVAEAARGVDVVFHAGGIAHRDAPPKVLRWVHVAGTENVLRAARFAGVKRVVLISCADVSLTSEDRMHWDEKRVLPDLPVGAHARTKLMAEELALAQSDEQLEVTALRPALLWGPDNVDGIARLTRLVQSGKFTLYGGGRNIVATTHIDNLVAAALKAALAPEAAARAYYVTDGEFLESREFYTRLFAALGLGQPKLHGELTSALLLARFHDLLHRTQGSARAELLERGRSALFDVSRATLELGYDASIDLEAKLAELNRWVHEQGGLDSLLARARPAPLESDVAEQIRAAGGE